MILLDSDHVSVLVDPRQQLRERLLAQLESTEENLALPVIVVEEQLRGWLADIHRVREVYKQIVPYLRLAKLIDFLSLRGFQWLGLRSSLPQWK